jgi:hypothetical protein
LPKPHSHNAYGRPWSATSPADRTFLPAALEHYDFVVFTDHRAIHVPSNRCLAPLFAGATFQIFAIVHDFDCAGPGG